MRTILLPLLLASQLTSAQPFSIGTTVVLFNDPARGRDVPCTVHYPAELSGADVPLATGTFPVLVLGHGFVMTVDAYANMRDGLVPSGYILVLPQSEGGFLPDHGAFGADLAFLAEQLQAENLDEASRFFNHILPSTALMGHSMGGGASFLGAAGNDQIQALVNFAAAETNPSAVDAAASVQVPTLVFAASEDCVTPAATNQTPMYTAVTSPCKAFVNVLGGGHCYFGANSFTCSFGELTCGPDLTISREEQHDVVNDLTLLWLDHFLKGVPAAINEFRDSLSFSSRITGEHTCISTDLASEIQPEWAVVPSPLVDLLTLAGIPSGSHFEVFDGAGRIMRSGRVVDGSIEVSSLTAGMYYLRLTTDAGVLQRPFIVQR